jgi:hypothetical protein
MQNKTAVAFYRPANMNRLVSAKARGADIKRFIQLAKIHSGSAVVDDNPHCGLIIMLAHDDNRFGKPTIIWRAMPALSEEFAA